MNALAVQNSHHKCDSETRMTTDYSATNHKLPKIQINVAQKLYMTIP